MLRITLFEFIFRGIPELILFILAAYIFSRTKIQKKDFIIAILVSNVGVFLIRNLPIGYGVHTILNIIFQSLVVIRVCKIDPIKTIKASILSTIILLGSEFLNVGLLNIIFKDDITVMFENIKIKTICGLPSLLIFAICISLYNLYIKKRESKCLA